MLGELIGGFIVILIGVTLAPSVANAVQSGQLNASGASGTDQVNITGSSATILSLTTLFYCLAVATTGMGLAMVGLRKGGLV
jgi:xanthine/uracil permease